MKEAFFTLLWFIHFLCVLQCQIIILTPYKKKLFTFPKVKIFLCFLIVKLTHSSSTQDTNHAFNCNVLTM